MQFLKLVIFLGAIALLHACGPASRSGAALQFSVSLPDSLAEQMHDGRLLLIISKNTDSESEPRFQFRGGKEHVLGSPQLYGWDIEDHPGDRPMLSGAELTGFPLFDLRDLPTGEYTVQALFHRYETFDLSTGHTVKLPMDQGEGQQWNRSPGNLYSTPVTMQLDPSDSRTIKLALDQVIPPITPPEDSKYVKHIRIRSELLSEFYGRPIYLGAHVLLPEGFDEHPDARYPLAIFHGHFPADFWGWRTVPADPDLDCEYSVRFGIDCYNRVQQESAYAFYQSWSGPDFPRVIAIEIQHANPYYDDSYAVNSANLGPYGDAITYELIPHIEQQFRGIGEGWARFLYGGSTGGWEAIAAQVFYPDEYNSCYAACPDPIDFRAYTLINLYEDENAYYLDGEFARVERPGSRDSLGQVYATLRQYNDSESALGSKSRSGQQWDIWEAVYSPQGEDGYPRRIWDKETGEIDPEVAAYWRENYDLVHILRRDWASLGPKLRGKINLYCGDMDNYYLNNAVYLAEEFLEQTSNPPYEGEVDYGDRAEHCWNGDQTRGNGLSRLRYHQMFIPKWTAWVQSHAPAGADLRSWRY